MGLLFFQFVSSLLWTRREIGVNLALVLCHVREAPGLVRGDFSLCQGDGWASSVSPPRETLGALG
jgi:hypothetical protein